MNTKNDKILDDIALAVEATIRVWGNHIGKGPDWLPTSQDFEELIGKIESDTPAVIEKEVKEQLGK